MPRWQSSQLEKDPFTKGWNARVSGALYVVHWAHTANVTSSKALRDKTDEHMVTQHLYHHIYWKT